ncbi:MAG: VWA domain-containing protein [Deltaproteobacteria bacterium]|nr:VWA domain-containing protein [Deltaproteobacteria bacterium]
MIFSNSFFLSLLLIIPFLIWRQIKRKRERFVLPFSSVKSFKGYKSRLSKYRWILEYTWIVALILLVIAFARPQMMLKADGLSKEGIDIMLAIDISGSMKEEGLIAQKLKVVQAIAKEFVKGRKTDRIGLVAFAGAPLMVCPPTDDYTVLSDFIDGIKFGMLPDGTALGDAVALSIDILKHDKARGRIIILLSDGINNSGTVDPLVSAKAARVMGVRVYTIEEGYAAEHYLVQRQTNWGMDIDLLKEVADISGGTHFKISDTRNLLAVYKEIEKIEKDKLASTRTEYNDVYQYLLVSAILIFLTETILLNTRFSKIP